jgi:hypothetical protein
VHGELQLLQLPEQVEQRGLRLPQHSRTNSSALVIASPTTSDTDGGGGVKDKER